MKILTICFLALVLISSTVMATVSRSGANDVVTYSTTLTGPYTSAYWAVDEIISGCSISGVSCSVANADCSYINNEIRVVANTPEGGGNVPASVPVTVSGSGSCTLNNGQYVESYPGNLGSATHISGSVTLQLSQALSCSQIGGITCLSGQTCDGGTYQTASDSSLCCVGGTCTTPQQTCADLGGICKGNTCSSYSSCTSLSGSCTSGFCCSGSCTTIIQSDKCVEDLQGTICSADQTCEGGNWGVASDTTRCCLEGTCTTVTNNCVADLSGTICDPGETCEGGTYQQADDSNFCCVGGTCTAPPQTCSDIGGSVCSSGQTCDGGTYQTASDSSLCCVGGTCTTPVQTCSDVNGNCLQNTCGSYDDCTGLSGTCSSGSCCTGTCTVKKVSCEDRLGCVIYETCDDAGTKCKIAGWVIIAIAFVGVMMLFSVFNK